MKLKLLTLTLLLTACGSRTDHVVATAKDGHSLVSSYQTPSNIECSNGGIRLDVYVDLNDDLTANTGDKYLNSAVVCNGLNGSTGLQGIQGVPGEQGPRGLQGSVGPQGEPGLQGVPGPVGATGLPGTTITITDYTTQGCTLIAGTSVYVKVGNNNSSLHNSQTCSQGSKLAEVSQGESYWVTNSVLGIYTSTGLRILKFN